MMKFGKGDVVHVVDVDADGFHKIGIVVDIDYKQHRYAVLIDAKRKTGTFWYNEDEAL